MSRIIFHIDMNSFFVACELAGQPQLKGQPVVVSGYSRRGVITTASYEARALGIHAAMPLSEALRICPTLHVLPVNHELYRDFSQKMMTIFQRYSQTVEQASIDEAYLEMSYLCDGQQSYTSVAREIQAVVESELGLGCSIGISYNRFLAKMASDMEKPNGLTILSRQAMIERILPLPIEQMYGVGPKTAEKFRALGIKTIAELASYRDEIALRALIGDKQAQSLQQRAKGNDQSELSQSSKEELDSIGHSRTLLHDTTDEHELETLLRNLTLLVVERMKRQSVVGKTLQVTLRTHNFKTITRSITRQSYFASEADIYTAALELFQTHWDGIPIRLLGITVQNLQPRQFAYQQLRLF